MEVLIRRSFDAGPPPTMIAENVASRAKLHPFFTNPRTAIAETSSKSEANNLTIDAGPNIKGNHDTGSEDGDYNPTGRSARGRRKRKSDINAQEEEPMKNTRPGRPSKKPKSGSSSIASLFIQNEADNGSSAEEGMQPLGKKRQRTSAAARGPNTETAPPSSTSANAVPEDPAKPDTAPGSVDPPKPKRMLEFNLKTGTLGSPPRAKEPKIEPSDESKVSRMAKGSRKASSLILLVKYSTTDDERNRIGNRIEEILKGDVRVPTAGPASCLAPSDPNASVEEAVNQPAKSWKSHNTTNSKPTHPFFLGKIQKTAEPLDPAEEKPTASSPATRFTSTPCSPNKSRRTSPPEATLNPSSKNLQFGIKNTGVRVPGARLPAWPWKGMVHVSGHDLALANRNATSHSLPLRKSKGNATLVAPIESVLANTALRLNIPIILEEVKSVNSDDFVPPPRELRLPQRHCESGRKLQLRIRDVLRTANLAGKSKDNNHGLAKFYESIQTTLSAYDRSQSESLPWTQKYAPTCAFEVLQPGRETALLRNWLVALQVQSVDAGPSSGDAPAGSSKRGSVDAVKKKRKRNKLDGFVVSSEDEANEMDELSETDDDWTPSNRPGVSKKTVIRTGDAAAKGGKDAPRLRNAVLISGPHGCGKTAAIYAVAKELGFEIFEIGSSSRRSGKDIMDKIGDMTRNHLVKHHQASASDNPDAQEVLPIDDQVAKEVQSGKQATMGAFFKAKTITAKSAKSKTKHPFSTAAAQPLESKKSSSKNQKQSLILLEEVDILYEEDRQFWASVITLIAQSRRPFVMTCNDETLVPLQTLNLHGIFRFSPPPIEIAVDRLLLMAASEGHVLKRESVQSLYESRKHDFRASIMELNYWCQIGVGDRRGGFDWFYLRWPKGIDLDENGDVVRVISEGTYEEGTGWLGDDDAPAAAADGDGLDSHPLQREVDVLQQSWDHFHLDLALWQDTLDMDAWAAGLDHMAMSTPSKRLAVLGLYDNFTDAMSTADLNSAMASVSSNKLLVDPTLPLLPNKAKDDFIVGLPLLEATPIVTYDSTATAISIALKALARRELQNSSRPPSACNLSEVEGSRAVAAIRKHLTSLGPSAPAVDRLDFAVAFDPIAASEEPATGASTSQLDPSVWDRTMSIIALDVAPFVRGIVAYDALLQRQRLRLSRLMSQGGKAGSAGSLARKKMRTTRAAYSAMEGGPRSTTRGERWFKADLNPYLVQATAPKGCLVAGAEDVEEEARQHQRHLQQNQPGDPRDGPTGENRSSAEPEPEAGRDLEPESMSGPKNGAKLKRGRKRNAPRKVVDESSDVDAPGESMDELAV